MPIKPKAGDTSMPTISIAKNAKDHTGKTFGFLAAIRPVGVDSKRHIQWECRCKCGSLVIVPGSSLCTGNTRSCGCLHLETVTTHGKSNGNSRSHRIWNGLKQRCFNENNPDFEKYGGRGITVCDRWKNSYEAFVEDMGEPPSAKHSLDRRNNDGSYCPENCRWATKIEQDRNKRTNRLITWNGETLCLTEWAERIGVHPATLANRLSKWSLEEAMTTPLITRSGPRKTTKGVLNCQ